MIRFGSPAALVLVGVFFLTLSSQARAQESKKADLTRAVKADAFLLVKDSPNPDQEFVLRTYGKALDALKESGFAEDIFQAVTEPIPPRDRVFVRELFDRLSNVVWDTEWHRFAKGERVFGEGMKDGIAEIILMAETEDGYAAEAFEEFRRLLEGVVFIADDLYLQTSRYRGAEITSLRSLTVEFVNLALFHRDDLLGVYFNPSMKGLYEGIDRLDGEGSEPSLVETGRFKRATSGFPLGRDSFVYFDIRALLSSIRERFLAVAEIVRDEKEGAAVFSLLLDILNAFEMFEYSLEASSTKGDLVLVESLLKFRDNPPNQMFFDALFDREPIDDFERFVPADARAFSLHSGVSLLPLYDILLDVLKKDVPQAGWVLEKWEEIQKSYAFDIREDLLSRIEGRFISVELPSRKPTAIAPAASITLIRLKDGDPALNEVLLEKWLDLLQRVLKPVNIQLSFKEVQAEGVRGGREVYQTFLPFMKGFICLYEDYLVLGTGKEDTLDYLEFLRTEGPNILENEKFLSLGLNPPSRVSAIHYRDLTNRLEEFQAVISFVGIASMMIQPDDEAGRVIRRVLGTLPKLASFVEAMDIYQDEAGFDVLDPKEGRLITRRVTRINKD